MDGGNAYYCAAPRQLIAKAPGLEASEDGPYVLALAVEFERAAAPLAYLGFARTPRMQCNIRKSREVYEQLLAF